VVDVQCSPDLKSARVEVGREGEREGEREGRREEGRGGRGLKR